MIKSLQQRNICRSNQRFEVSANPLMMKVATTNDSPQRSMDHLLQYRSGTTFQLFQNIPEYSRIFLNIPKYSQVFLNIFEYFRIFCNILEYSRIKWNNNDLEYSIISCSILEYSMIFQNIPEYSHWKVVLERYMYITCIVHKYAQSALGLSISNNTKNVPLTAIDKNCLA